jgi:HD-like signal output (HDOD) protein
MFTQWLGKVFGRLARRQTQATAADTAPQRDPRELELDAEDSTAGPPQERRDDAGAPPVRMTAGSRATDRRDIFDPNRISEFDPRQRGPLPPAEIQQIQQLGERVLAHCARSLQAGAPLPALAQRILVRAGAREGESDINRLVQLINQDPAITVQVLHAANGVSHSGYGEVRGVREAVMRLGLEAAGQIAMVTVMNSLVQDEARKLHQRFARSCRQIWIHALTTAAASGTLAMDVPHADIEEAFIAGLLHDVGKIFALRSLSALSRPDDKLSEAMVECILEEQHPHIGRLLGEQWGLPATVGLVCRVHHDNQLPRALDRRAEATLHIVRVVSGMDEVRVSPWHRLGTTSQLLASANALELNAMAMRALFLQIKEARDRAMTMDGAEKGGT